MISNHPDALIIFAKWPEPGRVKTRLSPPLSREQAAELYRCMLLDTLDVTSGIAGIRRFIFFDGPEERAADFRMMAPDAEVCRQSGNDLGERLIHAFETVFSHGFRQAAVIGTDAPHMPPERITEAFSLLSGGNVDVVIGPSEDGGYYLVGMNAMYPRLLQDIPWSTPEVMATTIHRAASAGLCIGRLPSGFDLDSADDLMRFSAAHRPGKQAPETASLLRSLPI